MERLVPVSDDFITRNKAQVTQFMVKAFTEMKKQLMFHGDLNMGALMLREEPAGNFQLVMIDWDQVQTRDKFELDSMDEDDLLRTGVHFAVDAINEVLQD